MCSKVCKTILDSINPTLNYQVENILSLPIHHYLEQHKNRLNQFMDSFIVAGKTDWNSYETSWDFTTLPLLDKNDRASTLKTTYQTLRQNWQQMTDEMKQLEEENNRIFIEAYGLQDELTPDVPLKEITLTCNPYYRYDAEKPETELEALLLADNMREFISYAVGCMFGRYSLDKPGLILANQGETTKDYYAKIPNPTFPPTKITSFLS